MHHQLFEQLTLMESLRAHDLIYIFHTLISNPYLSIFLWYKNKVIYNYSTIHSSSQVFHSER